VTLHGVTKEVTWNVVAVLGAAQVGGRATTTVDFAMFNMTKPTLARLMSVDDKIGLEIEFRCTRRGFKSAISGVPSNPLLRDAILIHCCTPH
jgi:hypothetical protein